MGMGHDAGTERSASLARPARKSAGMTPPERYRRPLLGLFFHPMNARAIKACKAAGFAEYFRKFTDHADNVEYVSMLLKLADALLST
jgi:hypothetical protein